MTDKKTKASTASKQLIVEGTQKDTKFYISTSIHLTYGGKEVFVACPGVINTYQLARWRLFELCWCCIERPRIARLWFQTNYCHHIHQNPNLSLSPLQQLHLRATTNQPHQLLLRKTLDSLPFVQVPPKHNATAVASHPRLQCWGTEGRSSNWPQCRGTLCRPKRGRGIIIRPSGEFGDVSPWGDEASTKGFAIKDSNLVLNGKQDWKACPDGENKFSLAVNDCTNWYWYCFACCLIPSIIFYIHSYITFPSYQLTMISIIVSNKGV